MQHVVDDVFVRLTAERRLATEHNVHDDAHGPDVTLGRVTALQHFWRDVVGRSVRLVHHLVGNYALGEAKVDKLDVSIIVFFVEQEVLWLDVAMADAVGVQVTQGVEGLLHD